MLPPSLPAAPLAGRPLQARSMAEYGRIMEALHQLMEQVDVEQPWRTPRAKELDAITFQQWWAGGRAGGETCAWVALLNL